MPQLRAASPASFSYADQRPALYLTPGDELHLTLDYARFDETLCYTGRGAAANNYLPACSTSSTMALPARCRAPPSK